MKRALACSLGALLLGTCAFVVSADELKLKDGTKIVGSIVGYEGDSFKVETNYGFALVRKDKVASIVISEQKSEATKPSPAAEPRAPANAKTPPSSAAANVPAPPVAKAPREVPMQESLEGNLYTNATYGFRLYKPPSWHLVEGARKVLPTAIVVMGTEDETTLFIVSREPLRQSLEQHAAASDRHLRDVYENYRPLGEKRTDVAGLPALEKRFRGTVEQHDWSVTALTFAREKEVFTLIGMTYADSDLNIQIQENVIARTISSLQFTK
jgi:hypothetical protein